MSNRRRRNLRPVYDDQGVPELASPALRAEDDGTLTVLWPDGVRPKAALVKPEAIEALVAAHNEALYAAKPPSRRSLLARLGGWGR